MIDNIIFSIEFQHYFRQRKILIFMHCNRKYQREKKLNFDVINVIDCSLMINKNYKNYVYFVDINIVKIFVIVDFYQRNNKYNNKRILHVFISYQII